MLQRLSQPGAPAAHLSYTHALLQARFLTVCYLHAQANDTYQLTNLTVSPSTRKDSVRVLNSLCSPGAVSVVGLSSSSTEAEAASTGLPTSRDSEPRRRPLWTARAGTAADLRELLWNVTRRSRTTATCRCRLRKILPLALGWTLTQCPCPLFKGCPTKKFAAEQEAPKTEM